MTAEEIKDLVRSGKLVFAGSPIYEVKVSKDFTGKEHWNIVCTTNGYTIGLTWQDGVTLNGLPDDFYALPKDYTEVIYKISNVNISEDHDQYVSTKKEEADKKFMKFKEVYGSGTRLYKTDYTGQLDRELTWELIDSYD